MILGDMNSFPCIDVLMQERRNFSANALGLCLSCINPSIWSPAFLELFPPWHNSFYIFQQSTMSIFGIDMKLLAHIPVFSTTLDNHFDCVTIVLPAQMASQIPYVNRDDRYFPRYWPFVRGIHRSPVNSPHKGQWRGALMFSFFCAWINGWVNNRGAGNLRRNRFHYDVIVMWTCHIPVNMEISVRLYT